MRYKSKGNKKQITLYVSEDIYKDFQELCYNNDLVVSKEIEGLMYKMITKEILNSPVGKYYKGGYTLINLDSDSLFGVITKENSNE